MSKIERVTVALPAETLESARAAVESGEYASTSEIVCDAMRLWENHRALQAQEAERLRKAYEEGIASGSAGPLDMAGIIAEAEAELDGTSKRRARG
jgi:antitoxin ParD1/3/4